MRRIIISLLIFLIPILLLPAYAQEKPEEAKAPEISEQLIQDIESAENNWLSHLENPPEIFLFHRPEEEKNDAREDKWRFRILELRDKSKTNRAWHQYWQEQAELSKKALALYDQAIATAQTAENLAKEKALYEFRKSGLTLWLKLAEDKMQNQDTYLRAIDKEKEAYESRLDASLLQKAKTKSIKDKPKEGDEAESLQEEMSPSPYREHQNLLHELKRQMNLQMAKEIEAQNDAEMTTKLIEAADILLKAAQADLSLAEREHEIAANQYAGAKQDKPWQKRWKEIEEKTTEKLETLKTVADSQKKSLASIKAEKAYFEALVEIKKDRASDIESQIAAEKSRIFMAVILTAKQVLMKKGLIVLLYILGAFIVIRVAKRIDKFYRGRADDGDDSILSDDEQRAETLSEVFMSIVRMGVYIVTFLLLLKAMGVNIGPLMGAFAIFGLAISFGSQNLVRDLVAGFFMLLEHQLSVGDVVSLGGTTGTVEKISLRRVVLRDVKGAIHSIPNGSIGSVTNNTHGWARAIVHVGVGYGDDLRKVKEVFNKVGQEMYEDPDWMGPLMEAPSFVGVTELGDSAVVVRVWARTRPTDQWGVERELNLRLKLAADENGIEIPFPQTVVTMANQG